MWPVFDWFNLCKIVASSIESIHLESGQSNMCVTSKQHVFDPFLLCLLYLSYVWSNHHVFDWSDLYLIKFACIWSIWSVFDQFNRFEPCFVWLNLELINATWNLSMWPILDPFNLRCLIHSSCIQLILTVFKLDLFQMCMISSNVTCIWLI